MRVSMTEVRDRVRNIQSVSTLPSVLARILAIVHNEASTAIDLATEIASDQALTLRVLRVVNSGYYGFHRRIATVPEAVVILGFGEVERLALAVSVINWFGHDARVARYMRALWQHSMACAIAADVIEQRCQNQASALLGAHAAGLLHDIGKAIIAQHFQDEHAAIHRLATEKKISVLEAEREILDGATHCMTGAWLVEQWGLPPSLVDAIAMHHAPEEAIDQRMVVCAAHVANAVVNAGNLCVLGEPPMTEVHPIAAEAIGVDDDLRAAITEQIEKNRGIMSAVVTGMGF